MKIKFLGIVLFAMIAFVCKAVSNSHPDEPNNGKNSSRFINAYGQPTHPTHP